MQRDRALSIAGSREVVVLSNDGAIRQEVSAAVSRRPGAWATFGRCGDPPPAGQARAGQIVVIDDEGQEDALSLVRRLKADRRDPAIVYLAANHSAALESAVRRAGASFYAVKAARDDGNLTRVIEVLLQRPHR